MARCTNCPRRCGCPSKTGDDPLCPQIKIVEGDFLKDPLPKGHDAVLLAHVVYVLVGAQPGSTPSRAAGGCSRCAPAHCRFLDEPYAHGAVSRRLDGRLMVGGNGDVYSIDEGHGWLEQSGWRYVEHKSLGGPATLAVAEAVAG
jgi:hypothetical protein